MKTFVMRVDLKEEEDGSWSESVPVFPGCSSWGYSQQEALTNIKDATEIYIEDMIEAGEDLPTSPYLKTYLSGNLSEPPGTLKNFLEGTKWSGDGLIRLRLRS